jgi:hypothetical protein
VKTYRLNKKAEFEDDPYMDYDLFEMLEGLVEGDIATLKMIIDEAHGEENIKNAAIALMGAINSSRAYQNTKNIGA